jgi:hypothetical protein
MTTLEREQMKQWVDAWKHAGKELRKIKMAELAAMTDEEARLATADLLLLGEVSYLPHEQQMTSGLVEQQRIFNKAHRRDVQKRDHDH